MLRTTFAAAMAALVLSPFAPSQATLGGALPEFDRIGRSPQDAFAVEVHDSGLMSTGGVPLLIEQLAARARSQKEGDIVIRADRGLPAQAVAVVLRTCAEAGASRIWLGGCRE